MIEALAARAQRALAHPEMTWLRNITRQYLGDPRIMQEMLSAATEGDPGLANAKPFETAYAAVRSWVAGVDLADRAARAWHDPAIQAVMGPNPERYWNDPNLAYHELIELRATRELPPALENALEVVAEYRTFGETHNVEMPDSPADPATTRPIEPRTIDHEYGVLIRGNVAGELTPGEAVRLERLAAARIGRDAEPGGASARGSPAVEGPSTAYQALIAKNAAGTLSATENAQLQRLAEAQTTTEAVDEQ